jgi:hypothetical protein
VLAREDDPFVKRSLYRTLNAQLFDAREAPTRASSTWPSPTWPARPAP